MPQRKLRKLLLLIRIAASFSVIMIQSVISFSSVYIIDKTCFDECFLFHVITGRHYFLHKFSVTQRFGAIAMLMRSLKQVF